VSRSLDTAPPAMAGSVSDYPAKLGEPYVLEGVTYTPTDVFNYDETGYASWYGKELNGRNTANGELFSPDAITGAHRTLPLPSYVEVTALDTGKTILVRLNDRGPSSRSRLIDLSYGAAKQLGVLEKGTFAVRVRRVNPPETERAMLRQGLPVAMRMETPESLLVPLRRKLGEAPKVAGNAAAPVPAPTPAAVAKAPVSKPGKAQSAKAEPAKPAAPIARPIRSEARLEPKPAPATPAAGGDRFIVEGQGAPSRTAAAPAINVPAPAPRPPVAAAQPASTSAYFVQVAAFSSQSRAQALATRIGAKAQASGDGKVYRVRYGPYSDTQSAQQGLTLAKRNGYQGARIQQDSGR
jgi:rare lipoprotein A